MLNIHMYLKENFKKIKNAKNSNGVPEIRKSARLYLPTILFVTLLVTSSLVRSQQLGAFFLGPFLEYCFLH